MSLATKEAQYIWNGDHGEYYVYATFTCREPLVSNEMGGLRRDVENTQYKMVLNVYWNGSKVFEHVSDISNAQFVDALMVLYYDNTLPKFAIDIINEGVSNVQGA